jgi:iron(III) transport system substrate-binding protein
MAAPTSASSFGGGLSDDRQCAAACPTDTDKEEDMKSIASLRAPRRAKFQLRRSLVLAGALALGAGLSAGSVWAQAGARNVPAAEWAKIQEAARKEGKVIVYGTMAPAVHDRIVAAFNAANPGIKMELVRVIGSAQTAKFEQERMAPGVEGGDVMLTADVRWAMEGAKKGYLKAPVGPAAAAYPDAYIKGGHVALVGLTPWVLNYNTNLVKTPITGYQDLLRPELQGKVGSTALVAEVVSLFYKWLDDNNPGYLEKLATQNVKMYPSSVAATNSTGSGEIAANAFSIIPIDNALHAQKAPLRTVIPNPAYGFAYGTAAVSWAKNPNAALVAVDFIMSQRGQAALVGNQEAGSPLPGVAGSIDIAKINLTLVDWDKVNMDAVKAFEGKWNKLFGAR